VHGVSSKCVLSWYMEYLINMCTVGLWSSYTFDWCMEFLINLCSVGIWSFLLIHGHCFNIKIYEKLWHFTSVLHGFHRWARHRPLCRWYPTSEIDIFYSNIWTIYVGLNSFILVSEEFWYRHQLPFWYPTISISDIPISKIDKSFPNDPRKVNYKITFFSLVTNSQSSCQVSSVLPLR
jgi:hypothetical protein